MTTAVDSSVLWAILKQESGHEAWLETLIQAASEGPLIVNPITFAELAPSTTDEDELFAFLEALGIGWSDISPAAAHVAGQTFKQYRKAGGPRAPLVPDFLIAAHAQLQADRLAATDRGYLRMWFPDLELLKPA